jgi:hypothetical protein
MTELMGKKSLVTLTVVDQSLEMSLGDSFQEFPRAKQNRLMLIAPLLFPNQYALSSKYLLETIEV